MHITYLAHKLDRQGGSSFSLDLMARQLFTQGHSVTVLTTNLFAKNDLPEDRPYSVRDDVIKAKTPFDALPKIKRVLDRYEDQTDIYHVFNPQYLAISGLYRKYGSVPTVGRLNAYGAFCTNPAMMDGKCHQSCSITDKLRHDNREWFQKIPRLPQYMYQNSSTRLINHLDRLFALSPTIKDVYSHNKVEKDVIDVVPNFYDPSFIPGMETHTDNYSDKFTILYVGRLRREKGVDLIIDAAQKLDMSNVSINLVGDGPQRNELEAKAKTANILKSTQFHGYVDQSNLPSYYENADIFVHPGRWPEPFGRTILEALQCDCPPVVSDIGAPPWVVGDAGITFERNNSADLVKKISKLRGSNDKLEKLTRNCQTRLEKFNPDPVITKIEETYTDIS